MKDVTLAIPTRGNLTGLCMTLSAVLNGTVVPNRIVIRFDGSLPEFGAFYLEQLSALALIRGSQIEIWRRPSAGIHVAREELLQRCTSRFLWFLDDDVLPEPGCLAALLRASAMCEQLKEAYIAGLKVDVNNRRGYADFSLVPRTDAENPSQNHLYDRDLPYECLRLKTLDTGNVLLVTSLAKECSFSPVGTSVPQAGGEDALFALHVYQKGFSGVLCIQALAWHLEKPSLRFDDKAMRAEMERLAKLSMSLTHDHPYSPQLEKAQ